MKIFNIISKLIFILLFILIVLCSYLIIDMNVLPSKYLYLILFIFCLIIIITGFVLLKSDTLISKIIFVFLSIFMGIGLLIGIKSINKINDFLRSSTTKTNNQVEEYYVLVNKNTYEKLSELENKNIDIYETDLDNYNKAINILNSKVVTVKNKVNDLTKLGNNLLDNNVDAILVSNSYYNLIKEDIDIFENSTKIIYKFTINVDIVDTKKNIDVTNKSFNLYISGIDTYGSINSVSRSDVNMLVTVNPNTNKVLLTSIPRDYYVTLHGKGMKDKLTHSGVYGVDNTITTIQDLFNIAINYYLRVNFTTLVKVVDVIGGINVNSDSSFTAWANGNCKYVVGNNHLDGKCALAFARERHAYQTGDRHRVLNQQNVLTAIINKIIQTPSLLIKYNDILTSLNGSFQTNVEMDSIFKLIKNQINNGNAWNIDNYSVDGTGSMEYTYTYRYQKLYVMIPNESTVNEAKNRISNIYNN